MSVHIYSAGLIAASVCAPETMTPEEVAAAVNVQSPTGISSPWAISSDPTFRTGQPNPCVCETDPSRRHYLMEC